jgi:hypothetical protein
MPKRRAIFFVFVQAALWLTAARGQQIGYPDAYALANQLADELELVRERMGRPYDDSPRLPVSDVSELELYFQVVSLLRRANQLAQGLAGAAPRSAGPLPSAPIDAADVYALLEDSLDQVRLVADAIGIEEQIAYTPRTAPIAPTGVFLVVIDANRQLNLMLDKPIDNADVYDEISTAVVFAAALLSMHPGTEAVPSPPPFDGYKRPGDVYRLLIECLDAIKKVAPVYGVSVAGLSTRRNIPEDIEPGHVYDLARIIVADLAAFVRAADAPVVRRQLPTAKHVFPTEVYALAGVLLGQLEALAAVRP